MPKSAYDLLKEAYEKANGGSLTQEQLNAIEIPSLKTSQLPDDVSDTISSGLYSHDAAINDPAIAGKIMGAKLGLIDNALKPILIKHHGWTEQQYNEKRKEKSGNTLRIAVDFFSSYEESVNKKIESALKQNAGASEAEIREALEKEWKDKFEATVSTNKKLQSELGQKQSEFESAQANWASEKENLELNYWLDNQIGGYKIQSKLTQPIIEGSPSAWSLLRPDVKKQLRESYNWIKTDTGFKPMNPEDPTMEVFDKKTQKALGVNEIFQSSLAKYLATSEEPPSGNRTTPPVGNGGGNNPIFQRSKGNAPKTGHKVGDAQKPLEW